MKRLFLILLCLVPLSCAWAGSEPRHEATPQFRKASVQKADSFALKLFRELAARKQGNIVLSPASLEATLHLLREGAAGKTRAALEALPLGQQGVASAMRVKSANALFVDEGLPLRKDVAELYRVPFTSRPDKAVRAINAWACKKTHDMVTEVARLSEIRPGTRMAVVNAVYLKEDWLHPFDECCTTNDALFTTADGRKLKVPRMYQGEEKFLYAEGKDWQAVALFYRRAGRKGEPGCFIGILPRGDARDFARGLTPERYDAIRRALVKANPQTVMISLPKMDIDSGVVSLREPLSRMGLEALFRPDADFCRFFAEGKAPSLNLTDAVQRCRVIVNERGTEAAAVSAVLMAEGFSDTPKRIFFDRPFIWVISDLTTSAPPYFIGLCEEP